jgi:hypothetical protein
MNRVSRECGDLCRRRLRRFILSGSRGGRFAVTIRCPLLAVDQPCRPRGEQGRMWTHSGHPHPCLQTMVPEKAGSSPISNRDLGSTALPGASATCRTSFARYGRGALRGPSREFAEDSNRSPPKHNRSLDTHSRKIRILKTGRPETRRQICGLLPETPKIPSQRPDSRPLTSANVAFSRRPRTHPQETAVAGWAERIRTALCRIRTGLSKAGVRHG